MTPQHRAALNAAHAQLRNTSPALARAWEALERARNIERAHEATVMMLREDGASGAAVRAAQARLNGMRTRTGKACMGVRQAGGFA